MSYADLATRTGDVVFAPEEMLALVARIREPVHVLEGGGRVGLALEPLRAAPDGTPLRLVGTSPPVLPEHLGDPTFLSTYRLRYPYAAGAMANGIATPALVTALGRAGMLGSLGAAGRSIDWISKGLDAIEAELGPGGAFASNLIHSPNEPDAEEQVVDLYLRRGVTVIEASAYMALTPSVVRYACTGLATDPDGRITRKNHVIAKISRPEVARRFLSPAPGDVVAALVAQGKLTPREAELAARVPVAEDVTVEADSAGHTDNRPLVSLLPTIMAQRDELVARHGYMRPVRVGAAGGLGTPASVAAAFSMGAAYALTGSVNQATVESGLSVEGRKLLAAADIADVTMAPASDMFELGVKVQVLKRGTMFAARAAKLYEIWNTHDSLESIPAPLLAKLEKETFQQPVGKIWEETRRFWSQRDPQHVARAEQDPKHLMALVFRWYLGMASRWAITGEPTRRMDYQIWCGPAMGAFNAWVAGSFLAEPANRTAVQVALNLLEGAAVTIRAQQLRLLGAPLPSRAFQYRPVPIRES